eukprot:20210-Heterococcus_DN1.PRE.1
MSRLIVCMRFTALSTRNTWPAAHDQARTIQGRKEALQVQAQEGEITVSSLVFCNMRNCFA